ncbi:hypothetical protein AJ80_06335 [Polytolypa hystricis UAMH7299]|uniref:K Homology domain-containing protein n=1 Tax=Polytolypa hystricis (strain UAMH7299) TaxID=1447883 RepID=A0A2B7XW92_POLH7|nr:hypothetical protein AJ80_06335 [Polytolypa hystricis UAMH7299]
MSSTILLPGDPVPKTLKTSSSAPVKLNQGLRLLSPRTPTSSQPQPQQQQKQQQQPTISPTQAGLLTTDSKRNTLSILTFPQRRYIPAPNDLVIAQIHHSGADCFYSSISPHTPHTVLAHLAFEGATRKTRPMLKATELVYARVLSVGVGPGGEVELTCVNPATGKAEPGGLGPLVGGMVFDVSVGFAARLMMSSNGAAAGVVVLEELGQKLEAHGGFEVAVGRNGKVWVDCSGSGDAAVKATVAIGRCLKEADERLLGAVEQKKLVSRILREMGLTS